MVQGLEGPLVTPSRRLCEILGASPQLDHIGLVPGVFICEPLAYLDWPGWGEVLILLNK